MKAVGLSWPMQFYDVNITGLSQRGDLFGSPFYAFGNLSQQPECFLVATKLA